ncbi:MAG: hypothetical protein AB8C46_10545 [Burkholderiaceae bacterium]
MHKPHSHSRHTLAAVLVALLVSACGTTSSPSIEPYAGKDNVGAVNPSMFVGEWNVRLLNPPKGYRPNESRATFSQDGSVVMVTDDSSSGMNLKLQLIGRWQATGDTLQMQMESIKETSGNPLGGLIAGMMNSMKERMTGTVNVYEATDNRIVVVGEEGQATEYSR